MPALIGFIQDFHRLILLKPEGICPDDLVQKLKYPISLGM